MSITRRAFIKLVAAGAALAALPSRALAFVSRPPVSIAALIQLSFRDVRKARLGGANWDSATLRRAEKLGQLGIGALGPVVVDGETEINYEPEEISTWIIWRKEDDQRTPEGKVNFVADLLDRAFDAHSFAIEQRLGDARGYGSHEYRYALGHIMEMEGYAGYAVKMFTALVVFDKQAGVELKGDAR